MSYTTNIYLITCLSNMHAGSGGENFGIVDKEVQRDPASGVPVVHASSLKGALREYFEASGHAPEKTEDATKYKSDTLIRHVFGSHPRESDGTSTQGVYKFFSAQLLSMPVRSNTQPYFNAASSHIIRDFLLFSKKVNGTISQEHSTVLDSFSQAAEGPVIVGNGKEANTDIVIEGRKTTIQVFNEDKIAILKKYIGEHPVIYNDREFEEIKSDLPVIARNHLENGISQNLWYEEIVPRQSRFYFAVMHPVDDPYADTFNNVLLGTRENPSVVQIGANATVGYGYCTISKV